MGITNKKTLLERWNNDIERIAGTNYQQIVRSGNNLQSQIFYVFRPDRRVFGLFVKNDFMSDANYHS